SKLVTNIAKAFSGYNLLWHGLAIVLTYFWVTSGFDWAYFKFFQDKFFYGFLVYSTGLIGGIAPIITPFIVFFIGKYLKSQKTMITALALGQAVIMGSLISSF